MGFSNDKLIFELFARSCKIKDSAGLSFEVAKMTMIQELWSLNLTESKSPGD